MRLARLVIRHPGTQQDLTWAAHCTEVALPIRTSMIQSDPEIDCSQNCMHVALADERCCSCVFADQQTPSLGGKPRRSVREESDLTKKVTYNK
eukprot:4670805-Pleurochrysis_carterae.AAC.4